MKLNKTPTNKVVELPTTQHHVQHGSPKQQKSNSELRGQRLADSMTAKIGSWAFLTAQSGVLVVWMTLNTIPGVPHWDAKPFILLNLVFSFASAYTAPVVLMSQNRQSGQDRKIAEADSIVNVKSGQGVELLHAKIDALQQQMAIQQQEMSLKAEQETELLHTQRDTLRGQLTEEQQQQLKEIQISLLPSLNVQQNAKFPKESSKDKKSKLNKSVEENTEFIDNLFC